MAAAALAAAAAAQRAALTAVAAVAVLRPPPVPSAGGLSFVALVCAHDEEHVLPAALASLERLDWPHEELEVVVVADNCTDATAAVARAAGATVIERSDRRRPGKPQALAFGLDWLARERRALDAVLLMDADCEASPNLIGALAARLLAGADAVQANYVVANAAASPTAGLRAAAFALVNTVRPAGRDALGLSCGLLGSGMALSAATLTAVPWKSFGLAEDAEQHVRLVAAGRRVRFAIEAQVSSAMPLAVDAAREQERRWEGGRLAAARLSPPLALAGLRRRDPVRLDAAIELLMPPQSLLMASTLVAGLAGALTRSAPAMLLASGALLAHCLTVVGGLLVARAPAAAWRGLALAPRLIVRKLLLAGELAVGRGASTWQRTARDAPQ